MTPSLFRAAALLLLASTPALAAEPAIAVPKLKVSTAKADITKGEEVFTAKGCGVCHTVGRGKLVGPDLQGVLTRRDPTWVAKIILRPEVMLAQDPEAKKLLTQYLVPMPNQDVDPKRELPLIMAYLKGAK